MTTSSIIVDQQVIESYNRGPLTEVFTPPSSCLSTVTSANGGLYFGHDDVSWYNPSCYPSSRSSTYTLIPDSGNWNQYYYSPGVCPEGWVQALTYTSYFTNAGDTISSLLFLLGSSTTAVLCCPSGYDYMPSVGHQCQRTILPSETGIVYATTTSSDDTTVLGAPKTTTYSSTMMIVGDGIPIWWQSTDLAVFAAATEASNSLSPSLIVTETTTATATSPGPSQPSGLSTGVKAAIGVTIPIVCIATILGIFFFFRRRGMNKRMLEPNVDTKERLKAPMAMEGELPTDNGVVELDSRPSQRILLELD